MLSSSFIVTYRIHHDADYQRRYASFRHALCKAAGSPCHATPAWHQTSSFYALRSTGTAATLCQRLCRDSAFDGDRDAVLVIDLNARRKACSGAIRYRERLEACLGF